MARRIAYAGIHPAQTRAIVRDVAEQWGRCPAWRELALIYIEPGPTVAERIHRAVRDEVPFVRETGEVIQAPGVTLQRAARFTPRDGGDCDCKTVLVGALAGAHGIEWRPMLLGRGPEGLVSASDDDSLSGAVWFHIWPQLWLGGRWVDCETCHPPEVAHLPPPAFGEHPADYMARIEKTF